MKVSRLFLLCVAAPTSLSAAYFGLIASDTYVSESRFVVRAPERPGGSPLGSLMRGIGFAKSSDDSHVVNDFVLSRDALLGLNRTLHLQQRFSDPSIDLLSRFGSVVHGHSFEHLFRFYKNHIEVHTDGGSSISTLRVRAHDPQLAWQMNLGLLDLSETLVNGLNLRAKADLMSQARTEVRDAEARVQHAALALANYRAQQDIVDPDKQSVIELQLIAKLQDELIATRMQLVQLQTISRENPQIAPLAARVNSLQREIRQQSSGITQGESSLNRKSSAYQQLLLENEFAAKQLGLSLASLENARNEASHQQLYIERIVQPHAPDVAIEPERLKNVLITGVLSLVVWGIASLLLAGVREHHE